METQYAMFSFQFFFSLPISVVTVFIFIFLFFFFILNFYFVVALRSSEIATFAFGFSVSCRNTEWSIVPLSMRVCVLCFVIFVIKTRIWACKKRFALTCNKSRLDWSVLLVTFCVLGSSLVFLFSPLLLVQFGLFYISL